MSSIEVLRLSFEQVAGHLANLEVVRLIVAEITEKGWSIEDIIQMLEDKMNDSEVTLRTDIRILVNEIRHMTRKSNG
ncbi:MAG: hypothetical protein ACFFAY_12760 [Promethearchaeota archaeon]